MILRDGSRTPDSDEYVVTYVTDEAEAASIRAAFAEGEKEDAFWREHYQEFVERFPDRFVAVARANGQVVASSSSLDYLFGFLAGREIDVKQVWVQFIAATPRHVSL